MMKLLLKPLQWLYTIYAFLMFFVTMLIALPFVVLGVAFGKIKGGDFIYSVCRLWGYVWYFLVGMRHKNIYEAPHDKSQQYIFVANHISYIDIPPVFLAVHEPLRVLGKAEMTKTPLFGIIYKRVAILVERSSLRKRAESIREMRSYLQRGVSIFVFPEGTFNETDRPLKDFYDGAFRIAIETATPIKPLLFLDTHKRLHYSSIFSLTPGISRVVFLETVPVEGLTLKDVQALKQKVYRIMEEGLMRWRKGEYTSESAPSTTNLPL